MSGYTQADVSAIVAGSRRANEMKAEINFILQLLMRHMPKKTLVSMPVEQINGKDYWLEIGRNVFGEPMTTLETAKGEEIFCTQSEQLTINNMPLVFVKPIYQALPSLVQEVSDKYPEIAGIINQLRSFA